MSIEILDPVDEAVRVIWAHRTALETAVYLILRDPHRVQDAVSEATLAMITHWSTYDKSRPFLKWGVTIARNTARQMLRDEERLSLTDVALDCFAEEVAGSGDENEREARFLALEHCVDRLPPRHRKLVQSRYYRNHGYQRLAERCGKTVGALHCIFSRLHRSLSECVLRALRNQ